MGISVALNKEANTGTYLTKTATKQDNSKVSMDLNQATMILFQDLPQHSDNTKNTKIINWYVSSGKTKKAWVQYPRDLSDQLEKAYQQYQFDDSFQKFVLDKKHYVNFQLMVQKCKSPRIQRKVQRMEDGSPQECISLKRKIQQTDKPALEMEEKEHDSVVTKKKNKKTKTLPNNTKDDRSQEDKFKQKVTWLWLDSSIVPTAIWIPYPEEICARLESGLSSGAKEINVDGERFVDISEMKQRRFDNHSRSRFVKREVNNPDSQSHQTIPNLNTINKIQQNNQCNNRTNFTSAMQTNTTNPIQQNVPNNNNNNPLYYFNPNNSASPPWSINASIGAPNTWTHQATMEYGEYNAEQIEYTWIQGLMNSTIFSYHTKCSTHPISFNNLKVTKVTRVQNPTLYGLYNQRKNHILEGNGGDSFAPLQKILTSHPMSPKTDSRVNEVFLFHGLNVKSVKDITKFGFDTKYCSLQGMFGAGLYFAENSSKSAQYCHGGSCSYSGPMVGGKCNCTKEDEMAMIVSRVLLGSPLVEVQYRGNRPGEFWFYNRREPKQSNGSIYNSVVGESRTNDNSASLQCREYIVYETSQVYPEYVVYFKREN